jgi:hypothetical protein
MDIVGWGSGPDGEVLAEIVRDALIEATRGGGSTDADGSGSAGKRPTDEGWTVGKARSERPQVPMLIGFSRSLVGEIDGLQGVVGKHWFLLGQVMYAIS